MVDKISEGIEEIYKEGNTIGILLIQHRKKTSYRKIRQNFIQQLYRRHNSRTGIIVKDIQAGTTPQSYVSYIMLTEGRLIKEKN